jgi:sulfate/thiosulfate transport system substrate-binding protein
MTLPHRALGQLALLLATLLLSGCKSGDATAKPSNDAVPAPAAKPPVTLTLGGYTTPREAYGKSIIPAFKEYWQKEHGQALEVRESYLASGAQARAIVGGFEADVAALSLEADIDKIQKAKLISGDWKAGEHAGMVTRSVVVIGVRKGNPKGIKDWADLAKSGVAVLTPNVRTSGGAMWNVLGIYGAALRGQAGTKQGDVEAATTLLAGILANVKIMDSGARDSMLNFERGVGDAIITYENEILVAPADKRHEYVTPKSTVLIENPVAVVDGYAKKHAALEVAQGFVAFLTTPAAQHAFAEHGLRPVVASVAEETKARFAEVPDLFTVKDLGGWAELQKSVFATGGVYDRALAQSRGKGQAP